MTALKHLVSAASLIGFAALALGSGGKGKADKSGSATTTSTSAANIGDTVTFDDSTWVVLSAKNLGQRIKPEFGGEKKTDGQFITVQYKVTNTQPKDDSVLESCKLVDAKSREFGPMPDEALYVGNGKKTMLLEQLPPSMPKEFWTIFEVPADATGLKFQARSLGPFPDKKVVDLGQLPAPAAPVASAAAASTMTQTATTPPTTAAPHHSAAALHPVAGNQPPKKK
jgi:hypothetical protein